MDIDWHLGDTQLILNECRNSGLNDNHTAYVLATAYHETAHTMKPVREAFWLSEGWRRDNLRYYPWYGRGYVQLTWRDNYERAGSILGVDLTSNADVVMRPDVAAKVLVQGMADGWFTGKSMSDYDTFAGMRLVVNGTDKADLIAGYADEYLSCMPKSSGFDWAGLLRFVMGMFKR